METQPNQSSDSSASSTERGEPNPPAYASPPGRRTLRALLSAGAAVIVCGVAAVLWAHMRAAPPLERYYQAPAFTLTNQDGQSVSDRSLRGHVWICDFIFTRCMGPCREMSTHMTHLQKAFSDPDLRFVSFSVDPEYDTPAQLKDYANQWAPGEKRWILLTGTTGAILQTAKGLHLTAQPATPTSPILHDERLLLVDSGGTIRGIYDTADADKMKKLPGDIETLLTETHAEARATVAAAH